MSVSRLAAIVFFAWGVGCNVLADSTTIGPGGVNATGLQRSDGQILTGAGVVIGQVEESRSSSPNVDDANRSHPDVVPDEFFFGEEHLDTAAELTAAANTLLTERDSGDPHGTRVAGVLISSDPGPLRGIVPGATHYTAAYGNPDVFGSDGGDLARSRLAMQRLATFGTAQQRARIINMSFGGGVFSEDLDGSAQLTQFIDWAAKEYDTLFVISGNQGTTPGSQLAASFNGIVVGASQPPFPGLPYARSWPGQRPGIDNGDPPGKRTAVDIIAPGTAVNTTDANNATVQVDGTSYAAPHVTGAAALLSEYAQFEIASSTPGWDDDALRHEVLKSVILNSADKLQDTGDGLRLGQTRDVLDIDLNGWAMSPARTDPGMPLDQDFGAGHLNVGRAVEQIAAGEQDAVPGGTALVAELGWDHHTAPLQNASTLDPEYVKYRIDADLPADSYISTTLVWDRDPTFNDEITANGRFDATFQPDGDLDEMETFFEFPLPFDYYDNLNLYIVPEGSTSVAQAIPNGSSTCFECTTEHLFTPVPADGKYEIWVERLETNFIPTDYALSWWAFTEPAVPPGDFDGNGMIDRNDFDLWSSSYGSTVTPGSGADGNGDGVIDAADYVVWRNAFESAATAAVPEPTALAAVIVGLVFAGRRRPGQA